MSLFDAFKELMPSPTEVIDRAIREKLTHPNKSSKYIKKNFSKFVEEIQVDAYNIYLRAEKSVGKRTLKKVLAGGFWGLTLELTFSYGSRLAN